MGKLFDIDQRLRDALEYGVDSETGELLEYAELAKLIEDVSMERDVKIDNICNYIKELDAEAKAIKTEMDNLNARKKSKENKRDSLKRYLTTFMEVSQLSKFETAKNVVSFRKSAVVELNETLFLKKNKTNKTFVTRLVDFKIDKNKIKAELKKGVEIIGANIVEKQNLQIK